MGGRAKERGCGVGVGSGSAVEPTAFCVCLSKSCQLLNEDTGPLWKSGLTGDLQIQSL